MFCILGLLCFFWSLLRSIRVVLYLGSVGASMALGSVAVHFNFMSAGEGLDPGFTEA